MGPTWDIFGCSGFRLILDFDLFEILAFGIIAFAFFRIIQDFNSFGILDFSEFRPVGFWL